MTGEPEPDRPPTPIALMTSEEYRDFVNQMHVLVGEWSPLVTAPGGSVDWLPDGPVVHGPWLREECAALLVEWLDAGLLALQSDWTGGPTSVQLRTVDARALLLAPDTWDAPEVENVGLRTTDRVAPWQEWFRVLRRPPE